MADNEHDDSKQIDEAAFIEELARKTEDAWREPVSASELLYLFNQYPFLIISGTEISPEQARDEAQQGKPDRQLTATSGWLIHDYGKLVLASQGDLLWSSGEDYRRIVNEREQKQAAQTEISDNPFDEYTPSTKESSVTTVKGTPFTGDDVGTTVKQAFDTAVDVMDYVIENKNWSDVFLVDGQPMMQWAAWVEASFNGIELQGFEPTTQDLLKRDRLGRTFEDLASRIKQRRGLGG